MAAPLLEGFENLANSVQQYSQIKQQDRIVSGQLDAMLQMQGPAGIQQLSQNGQTLAQKFLTGNARLPDKMQLLGEVQTAMSERQMQQQMMQQQLQTRALQNQVTQSNLLTQGLVNSYGQQQNGIPSSVPQFMPGGTYGQPAPSAAQVPGVPQGPPSPPPPGVNNMLAQPPAYPGATPPSAGAFLNGTAGASPVATNPAQPSDPTKPQYDIPLGSELIKQPPLPVSVTDPRIASRQVQYFQAAMGDKDKMGQLAENDANKLTDQQNTQWANQMKQIVPTGRFVFMNPETDPKTGQNVGNNFAAEMVTAPNTPNVSYSIGDKRLLPPGVAPGKIVMSPGDKVLANMAQIKNMGPFVQTAPGQQDEALTAGHAAMASTAAMGDINLLEKGTTAYSHYGTSNLNVLRANPTYADIVQFLTGANPAETLQTQLKANTSAILNQIKSGNGSTVGGRILQSEFTNLEQQLATPGMDNAAIYAGGKNFQTLGARRAAIDNAYADFINKGGMSPAQALQSVREQFAKPSNLINAADYYNIPQPAIAALKSIMQQRPANPQEAAMQKKVFTDFESKYGNGMANMANTINQ